MSVLDRPDTCELCEERKPYFFFPYDEAHLCCDCTGEIMGREWLLKNTEGRSRRINRTAFRTQTKVKVVLDAVVSDQLKKVIKGLQERVERMAQNGRAKA